MTKVSANNDYFAEIATARMAQQREFLETPPPPVVSETALPWAAQPAVRRRAPRMSTVAEMKAALGDLRTQYAPFMADHAPALPVTRDGFEFTRFDWRVETAEDPRNFPAVLDGAGEWQDIALPHYGPPLGKAATLYRCEFEQPVWAASREVVRLHFGGVDYRCQVYLNGHCVGTHEGFFERFHLDCTAALRPGKNVLLVRVENDYTMLGENMGGIKPDGDKIYAATGLGYDEPLLGWHHCPAAMGIWNFVRLEGSARLFIDDLWVRPLPDTQEIEIHAEIESRSANLEEDVTLSVSVFGQNFPAIVHRAHLYRGEAKFVRGYGDLVHGFDEVTPLLMGSGRNFLRFRLPLPEARQWSPATPWLYQVQARLLAGDGSLLDARKVQFGQRSFVQDENSTPKGKFYLNGKEIRLRGANTMGNFERCIMKGDLDGLRDQILLAKLTNMNFLRMTQRPVHDEFYEYCDRLGIMTQTDLPMFSTIRRTQFNEVCRQAGAMERHVRAHCCNIICSFINEPRPAAATKPHRFLLRDEMESLFANCKRTILYHNPDRVLKFVDGDYDPPASEGMPDNHVYCGWYLGHGIDIGALHQGAWLPVKPGWHYGCGEFGSEGLDSYEVMVNEYPEGWKPSGLDAPWSPAPIAMSQSHKYHYLWYDSAVTARGWIDASQDFQSWVTELQTHAYRRMPWMNTFAIHLFIDAWPAGWMKTIMDVYCTPKKAWFTYRDALQPVIVSLRSDRTQVYGGESLPVELWLCNDHPEATAGMRIEYDVRMDGKVILSGACPVAAPACAPACQGRLPITVPVVAERARLAVGVTLIDADGRAVHEHEIAFSVFPRPALLTGKVWCPGADAGARRFVERLGLQLADTPAAAATVLVANSDVLRENLSQITAAVQAGARAVLLELEPDAYQLGSARLTVRQAGMGPRHFVSRATGHAAVRGFEANDFRFWFHESLGRCAPILTTILDDADAWTPILQSGDGGWTKPWSRQPAAVEIADGKGLWRVCQITLPDCIAANPVAHLFAARLFATAHVGVSAAPAFNSAPARKSSADLVGAGSGGS
jgi:hypothetical protein